MYSLTYSLALTHTHTPTLTHTSRCLATIHFFTCAKKLWKCWLSIAEMFCETFSETSFTFKTAPWRWTTNCNHSKSALIEWCKLPSSSENVKRFKQMHKKKQEMWHTCFEAGLVDFNLSSYWLRVLQVGKVVEGFRAGGSTGEAVGHGLSGTVRPPTLDLIVHSHQLEETNTQRLKQCPEYSKIFNIVCTRSKMNELSSR